MASRLSIVEPEGLGKAAVGLQRVAVLSVPRGVLGAGQEQSLPIAGGAVTVVLQEAETQLLVVRIIAELAGGGGQQLDERGPVEAGLQIGRREVDRLVGPEGQQRLLQAP